MKTDEIIGSIIALIILFMIFSQPLGNAIHEFIAAVQGETVQTAR